MNFAQKAISYLEAKFGGVALPDVQLKRLAQCFACEYLLEEREKNGKLDATGEVVSNPYYYCKKCGCPRTRYWKDSELRKKVTFNKLECPLGKWTE